MDLVYVLVRWPVGPNIMDFPTKFADIGACVDSLKCRGPVEQARATKTAQILDTLRRLCHPPNRDTRMDNFS
jgi:hypothetical protein